MKLTINKGWFLLWLIPVMAVAACVLTGNEWFIYGFTLGLTAFGCVCLWSVEGRVRRSASLLWIGILLTMVGDYFLAIQYAPTTSNGFTYGVCGFIATQGAWLAFFFTRGRFKLAVAVPLFLLCGIFYGTCLFNAFPIVNSLQLRLAVGVYAVLSLLNLSFAAGAKVPGGWWFVAGIGMLLFSDMMIAMDVFLYIGQVSFLVGPTYIAAMTMMAIGATCFTLKWNPSSEKNVEISVG